jgi:thiamine pyridinylase
MGQGVEVHMTNEQDETFRKAVEPLAQHKQSTSKTEREFLAAANEKVANLGYELVPLDRLPSSTPLSLKDAYTETGINYRYFLTWRQAVVVGYLSGFAAVTVAFWWAHKEIERLSWAAPLGLSVGLLLFSGLCWMLEFRNRDLYRAGMKSGKALEEAGGLKEGQGIYSLLDAQKGGRISQSWTLNGMFFVGIVIGLMGAGWFGILAFAPASVGVTPRELRVVLYPYVPARAEYFYHVQRVFESRFPETRLKLVDLSGGYYDKADPNSLAATKADIYEIDSVYLYDFVTSKRIQELPAELRPKAGEFLRNAEAGSQVGGKWYGVPHWVCGNFLFYKKSDVRLGSVSTLGDLEGIVGGPRKPGGGLFVDLKGKSTLGELYLDSEFDRHREWSRVEPHLARDSLDANVVRDLIRVLRLCERGYCRSQRYHENAGFYARQFARGRARALVGYSEMLFYLLLETQQSCADGDGCIRDSEVGVRGLPLADAGSWPISWVDTLTIDDSCTGQCRRDAIAFVQFLNSEEILLSALLPDGIPPRYLLPARASVYTKAELAKAAPLYPALRTIIEKAVAPTGPNLNEKLREVGREVDSRLEKLNQ